MSMATRKVQKKPGGEDGMSLSAVTTTMKSLSHMRRTDVTNKAKQGDSTAQYLGKYEAEMHKLRCGDENGEPELQECGISPGVSFGLARTTTVMARKTVKKYSIYSKLQSLAKVMQLEAGYFKSYRRRNAEKSRARKPRRIKNPLTVRKCSGAL